MRQAISKARALNVTSWRHRFIPVIPGLTFHRTSQRNVVDVILPQADFGEVQVLLSTELQFNALKIQIDQSAMAFACWVSLSLFPSIQLKIVHEVLTWCISKIVIQRLQTKTLFISQGCVASNVSNVLHSCTYPNVSESCDACECNGKRILS